MSLSPPGVYVIGLSLLGVGLSASNEARLKVCMDKQRAKEGKGICFCRSVLVSSIDLVRISTKICPRHMTLTRNWTKQTKPSDLNNDRIYFSSEGSYSIRKTFLDQPEAK